MLNFENYENKCFYPDKKNYTTYSLMDSSGKNVIKNADIDIFLHQVTKHLNLPDLTSKNMFIKVADTSHAIFKYFDKDEYLKHLDDYNKENQKMFYNFKNDMFQEYGVEDNPKVELLFNKCWDLGHSNGFSDVYYYFSELVDLIK